MCAVKKYRFGSTPRLCNSSLQINFVWPVYIHSFSAWTIYRWFAKVANTFQSHHLRLKLIDFRVDGTLALALALASAHTKRGLALWPLINRRKLGTNRNWQQFHLTDANRCWTWLTIDLIQSYWLWLFSAYLSISAASIANLMLCIFETAFQKLIQLLASCSIVGSRRCGFAWCVTKLEKLSYDFDYNRSVVVFFDVL